MGRKERRQGKGKEGRTGRTYRAPMNMPTECDAVWRTVAMHMMVAPKITAARRPRPSDMYGENGYAARHPMFCVEGGGQGVRTRGSRAGDIGAFVTLEQDAPEWR